MNTQFKIILYLIFVFGIFYYIQTKYEIFDISFTKPIVESKKDEQETEISSLEILNSEGKKIVVGLEIADTPILRQQGLSNRKSLGDYQGMLFVFDSTNRYSFWMKDMFIALDIIYISESFYIVDIFKDVQPCSTTCTNFIPKSDFRYVLEVNTGFTEINRIDIGNAVIFGISSQE